MSISADSCHLQNNPKAENKHDFTTNPFNEKRFPLQTGITPAQDGKSFCFSVSRIVTLRAELCKYFLRGEQLKDWVAINKEIEAACIVALVVGGTMFSFKKSF